MRTTIILFAFLLLAGCGEIPAPAPKSAPKKPTANISKPTRPAATKIQRPKPAPSSKLPSQFQIGHAEADAVKKITTVIGQSLELGPTLVVWLFDRTQSAEPLVQEIAGAALLYYQSAETQATLAATDQPLLTSIATFDDQTQFPLDPPTADLAKIQSSLEGLATSKSARERPLTAATAALEKYLPIRTRDRRELVLVIVTDEAGEDADVADELIETTCRHAIEVYTIGLPAPWGQVNPFAADPKTLPSPPDEETPVVGPESVMSERVDIANWLPGQYATEMVDSGFGPFALERVCRASRGKFLALRGGSSVSARSWPTGGELQFDAAVVERYAPDYVAAADYQKLLAENKARAALVRAAKMPPIKIDGIPGARFPKADEAKMARQISQAQHFAASNAPRVDRLYEVLVAGEADRAKLDSPRWQAEYDLALGRALANKARLDGYNSMLAALKRGKTFQKPASREWVLEPADHFETESTIQRMADKAKTHLQRVIQDHAGTPWAQIAAEELKLPLGWSWTEN